MARAAVLLVAPLLLGGLCAPSADTGSLCLDFTIRAQSRPGQPWCQVQGSLDAVPFLHNEGNSSEPLGFLGKEINPNTWTEMSEAVEEEEEELRKILLNFKLDKNKSRGPLTLHAKMCCAHEKEQLIAAFWNLTINGKYSLHFDAMNMKWTAINPEAEGIKEQWKKNKERAKYFRKSSMGDCAHWHKELLKHTDARNIEPLRYVTATTTTQHPSVTQHPSYTTRNYHFGVIASFIFICAVIFLLFPWCRKVPTDRSSASLSTRSSQE